MKGGEGMESDDLLCSRNARPPKALVGRAQWKINQPPSPKRERAGLEGAFRQMTLSRARSEGQLLRPSVITALSFKIEGIAPAAHSQSVCMFSPTKTGSNPHLSLRHPLLMAFSTAPNNRSGSIGFVRNSLTPCLNMTPG